MFSSSSSKLSTTSFIPFFFSCLTFLISRPKTYYCIILFPFPSLLFYFSSYSSLKIIYRLLFFIFLLFCSIFLLFMKTITSFIFFSFSCLPFLLILRLKLFIPCFLFLLLSSYSSYSPSITIYRLIFIFLLFFHTFLLILSKKITIACFLFLFFSLPFLILRENYLFLNLFSFPSLLILLHKFLVPFSSPLLSFPKPNT